MRRRLLATISVGAVVAALALGVTDAHSSEAIRPAPGSPDPRLMVLTSADLGRARVTVQRYFKDSDFPSTISYERELEDGRLGSIPVPYVDSGAEVGTSAATTARFLRQVRRLFGTREFRVGLAESLVEEEVGPLVSKLQVGRPRDLGAGPGSFDLPITLRVLGLRTDVHIAVFSVERVLGAITAVGEPGRRLPLSAMTRMAKLMSSRMTAQLTPRNTALPVVSGAAAVGGTLTATAGSWTGSPTGFGYQWQRCDPAGANCSSIAGSTGQTYVLQAGDVGSTIRVSVTARSGVATASAVSAPTSVISAAGSPVNTSLPTISGTATVGQTLTAATGTWTGAPTSYGYQWQRCTAAGTGCADVVGATGASYVVGTGDVSLTLRVLVTATNSVGGSSAPSLPTPVVS